MVVVYPACSSREFSREWLCQLSEGWNEVFRLLKEIGVGVIAETEELEITLLDDDEMSRIHGEFLEDATPTDVITFDHGELLVGVETAEKQAEVFASSADREIALYGIHGMLHLAGFDDRSEKDAKVMGERQIQLLKQFFPTL